MQHNELISWTGNTASLAAIAATLAGWLPPLAAVFAIIWYCVQIYESKSFQSWVKKRRDAKLKRLQRAISKLNDEAKT